ncbi:MAG: hypothetical protein J6Q96_02825 [Bacteroidales bacterium]|nr:hypothetical protein [Bacteroidales bacterium]
MSILEELHNAYMSSRDYFDNYNFDDDYEAQKINEYYRSGDEVVELTHWTPVAKDKELERNISKFMQIKGRGK